MFTTHGVAKSWTQLSDFPFLFEQILFIILAPSERKCSTDEKSHSIFFLSFFF